MNNKPDLQNDLLCDLCDVLVNVSLDKGTSHGTLLFYGVCLLEWMIKNKGLELSTENLTYAYRFNLLRIAKCHVEIWNRQGVIPDSYHLLRAKELFESYFNKYSNWNVVGDWIEYFRTLFCLGMTDEAAVVIQYIISNFERDSNYANYLFYAGCLYKFIGQFEKANNYFFDSIQVGPPRHFSQIDMMIIISRNLQELNSDTENDEAFRTVRICLTHFINTLHCL